MVDAAEDEELMSEIPDDIRAAARRLVERLEAETIESDGQGYGLTRPDDAADIIAVALLAEREAQKERDAKIAERVVVIDHRRAKSPSLMGQAIAAGIRRGTA